MGLWGYLMSKDLKKTAHKICSLLNFAFIMSAFIIVYTKNHSWEQTKYTYKFCQLETFSKLSSECVVFQCFNCGCSGSSTTHILLILLEWSWICYLVSQMFEYLPNEFFICPSGLRSFHHINSVRDREVSNFPSLWPWIIMGLTRFFVYF